MKKKNKHEPMRRDFFVGAIRAADEENAAEGEDSRRVALSLSSEEPCRRWFGNEILCHDSDAVDLSRLQDIGVVLFFDGGDHVEEEAEVFGRQDFGHLLPEGRHQSPCQR